jgi:hypothetical protein
VYTVVVPGTTAVPEEFKVPTAPKEQYKSKPE